MHKRYPVFNLFCFILCTNLSLSAHAAQWRDLATGIAYQELTTNRLAPWSHIHAFRIDLKSNQLGVVLAKQLHLKYASVDELAQHSDALIAINGGFFDKKFHSLGLRINNYRQLNPLKHISWWGVLYTKNNKASLSSFRRYRYNRNVNFAIQSGPRLLINGRIPPLKPGSAERSAIGIDKNNHVLLLVTDNTSLTTTELAQLMRDAPLHCIEALNLDGGSSSQLYAKIGSFHLNVHGFSDVSDAIIVQPS